MSSGESGLIAVVHDSVCGERSLLCTGNINCLVLVFVSFTKTNYCLRILRVFYHRFSCTANIYFVLLRLRSSIYCFVCFVS
jgi:hypothetical protein